MTIMQLSATVTAGFGVDHLFFFKFIKHFMLIVRISRGLLGIVSIDNSMLTCHMIMANCLGAFHLIFDRWLPAAITFEWMSVETNLMTIQSHRKSAAAGSAPETTANESTDKSVVNVLWNPKYPECDCWWTCRDQKVPHWCICLKWTWSSRLSAGMSCISTALQPGKKVKINKSWITIISAHLFHICKCAMWIKFLFKAREMISLKKERKEETDSVLHVTDLNIVIWFSQFATFIPKDWWAVLTAF